jgi:hypothetical protein
MTLSDPAKNMLSRVAKGALLGAPAGILVIEALTGGRLTDYVEKETLRELLLLIFWWGPALLILGALYRLICNYAPQFIEAQRGQAAAIQEMSDAIREHNQREHEDREERKELSITLKVLAQKIEELKEQMSCRKNL